MIRQDPVNRFILGRIRMAEWDFQAIAGYLMVVQLNGLSLALSCLFFSQCYHLKYSSTNIYVAAEWNRLV